ncbi:hypothetical protein C8A01DRAFT_40403 [Parachaetomium inaequale]|uniref:Uncharacterized protein n=1 Tax=Parachaetomium inaequale TaxID=2588326 RepID=A0AAN6SMX0_9PEZI|nr:hypothetical protein C8A01DRAFT_40403 [Parachaetomium inaequale]
MSSKAFAHNLVCLRVLGEQVTSQRLLHNLCLVSRLFNHEFSRFLYRHIVTRANHSLSSLVDNRHLRHVKATTMERGGSDGVPLKTLYKHVKKILTKMPGLDAFTWRGPLGQEAVNTLRHSCKTIKRLHINSTGPMEQWEPGTAFDIASEGQDVHNQNPNVPPHRLNSFPGRDVSAFTGLEELTVTYVHREREGWTQQVAKVLGNSPNLRKLGLHITPRTSTATTARFGSIIDWMRCFNNLCKMYAEAGAPPLKLRSLKCGTAMYPTELGPLEKLTDLAYLEEVHLDNASFYGPIAHLIGYGRPGKIIFDAFLSPRCPRLRRFSATRLGRDVFDALRSPQAASLTQRLAVSFGTQLIGDVGTSLLLRADPGYPGLPVCLRMMTLDLRTVENEQTVEGILNDLVATNADTLEGLAVDICRIHDINEDSDHLALLLAALPRLPLLTQLLILMDRGRGSDALTEDTIERVAERFANVVPSLRYIGLSGIYWRVWRFGSSGAAATLERLHEGRERAGVELFSIAFISFQVAPYSRWYP